jgi:hypothetical protein
MPRSKSLSVKTIQLDVAGLSEIRLAPTKM